MTRGNQRERDRAKNLKEQSKQKGANTLSGSAFQRKKEDDAQKMREKQAKADAKKAAEAAGGKKK
ncbi:4F5 domain protein [Aspergillus lucknowensis]|uniref:Small EDRK-rich factor-like N-terminal domain-containing protein n=1 Tax=Aspergillus lucknowensis TaxID=176173 RepID=A0ABR4LF45_9EURO